MTFDTPKKLMLAGFALLGVCMTIWVATIPPEFPDKKAKAEWEAYKIQKAKRDANPSAGIVLMTHIGYPGDTYFRLKQRAHKQCFWSSHPDGWECPMGGFFFLFIWAGLLSVGGAFVVRMVQNNSGGKVGD